MRDSRARTALALICVVLAALRFEALSWVIPLFGLILTVVGAWELTHLARAKEVALFEPMAYVGAVALYLAGLVPTDVFPWLVVPLLAALVVGAFVAHMACHSYEGSVTGVSVALLPAVYLAFALACGLQVLCVDKMYFLFVLVCVWAMDSAAYYFGCAWGRHKMAPRLSPKKSWEGAAAAVVGALITAAIARPIFCLDLSWPAVLELGLIFGVVGQFGDLAESALKRDAGVKDSGGAFGGHGGVLDRIDSLLFCFMAFYVWLLVSGQLDQTDCTALMIHR
jgi:phosphatidate cytidylyltransferase